jgi:hypothetical protein
MKTGAELVGRANPTALFIGAVAAVSTIAIGIGLVVFVTSGNSEGGGSDSSRAAGDASTTTTTASSTTTTTTAAGGLGSATTPTSGAASSNGGAAGGTQEDPQRAYSDPEDPIFQAPLLPAGISATLTPGSCAWDAANGGELQASGTVTAGPEADDGVWFVTVYWLQNDRELDEQFKEYPVEPGQTVPWRLTTTAPLPPAEPFRCALEIE